MRTASKTLKNLKKNIQGKERYSKGLFMRKKGTPSRLISKKEVEHLAWLSRVSLSGEEKKLFTGQLNNILNYFKLIDEADTKDVPPTYNVLDLTNVFRKDVVKPSLPRDEALKNAPKKEKGYFKAPRIV